MNKQSKKGQPSGLLWNGDPRLDLAKQVLNSDDNWLNKIETEFVKSSISRRQLNSLIRWSIAGIILALLLSLLGYIWYQLQLSQLREQAARSENLVENDNPVDGLALAIQAIGNNYSTPLVSHSILPDVKFALSNAVQTVRETNRFQGDTGVPLTAVAFSPDGNMIVTGAANGKITLWNTTAGKLREFSCLSDSFQARSQNSDEQETSGSGSSQLENSCPDNSSQAITAIAFSRDGQQILSGRHDGKVQLWDLQGNSQEMWEHSRSVESVVFLAGNKIISSSGDGSIYIGNSGQNSARYKSLKDADVKYPNYIGNFVTVSQDGEKIAVVRDDEILLGNSQSNTLTLLKETEQQGTENPVDTRGFKSRCSVEFLDDQTLLIGQGSCADMEGSVSKFNYEVQKWELGNNNTISPNETVLVDDTAIESVTGRGGAIASDGSNNSIQIDKGNYEFILSGHTADVNRVVFNPTNPNQIVSVSDDSTIRFWDISDRFQDIHYQDLRFKGQDVEFQVNPANDFVTSTAFSPNGDYFAIGRGDTVMLFDAQGQLAELPFEAHTDDPTAEVTAVAFSPDGKTIASGRNDNAVHLWDLAGNHLHTFEGYRCEGDQKNLPDITAVAFSPDEKTIAFSQTIVSESEICKKHLVQLWNLEEKRLLHTLEGHEGVITTLAFSPDGKIVASGSKDRTARLWNVNTGEFKEEFEEHKGTVNSVVFRPKSNSRLGKLLGKPDSMIISGSEDRTIRFWDLQGKPTGIEVLQNAHSSGVKSVLFRDENTIVSTSDDQTIKFWNLDGSLATQPLTNRTDMPEFSSPVNMAEVTESPHVTLAFNPNTSTLLTSINGSRGRGSYIRLFEDLNDWQDLLQSACQQLSQHNWLMQSETTEAQDARGTCEKLAEDFSHEQSYSPVISAGDNNLILTTSDKQSAVEAIASGNFSTAEDKLKASLDTKLNDPEARVYFNNARIANQEHHTIAVSLPITTNPNAALEILRGVAQAQEVHNKEIRNNKTNNIPIKVLIADDHNDPEIAQAIAQQLADDPNILGVVGHYSSGVTTAAADVYKQEGLVAISAVSTSVGKLPNSLGDYVFRTVPNDRDAAESLAAHMLKELRKTKAAVFYNSESEYSDSLYSAFESAIEAENGQVIEDIDLSKPNAADLIPTDAEVIALFPSPSVQDQALEVIRANQRKLPILAGDDMYGTTVLETAGEQATSMVVAVPWHIDAHSDAPFVDTACRLWKAKINWRTAMAYDATKALIAAIKQSPIREGVAAAIRSDNFAAVGATEPVKFSAGERDAGSIQLVKIVESNPGDPSYSGYDYAFTPEPLPRNQGQSSACN